MFQLSQTHNKAFQAKAEADFVREVMQYLRENHAETIVKLPNGEFTVSDLHDATLQKMVEGGIAKARSYGMTWRSTLISFVVIMFVSAPNFFENKRVGAIFINFMFNPNMITNEIWDETTENTWNEIEENYQVLSW